MPVMPSIQMAGFVRVTVALLLALVSGGARAQDLYLAYSGTAQQFKGGGFLYHERHWLLLRDGHMAERVVLYTCADGAAFARKTATYTEPLAPSFDFEDRSNGMRQGVRASAGGRSMYFRASADGREKSAPLPAAPLVIDTGFDAFIQSQWQALLSGQSVTLQFLVPSRQQTMQFQVQRLRSETLNGTPAEVFRMKLNGALGWVLSGIDVTYAADSHVLMRYEGVADLRNPQGDNFAARIVFPLNERKPVAAAAFDAARNMPLTVCR
jgi:hypothetical protein